MNKTLIKNFAVGARRKLIADITDQAALLGIDETGIAAPLPSSTHTMQFFDIGTEKPVSVSDKAIEQRFALIKHIEEKAKTCDYKTAFQFVIEEVAYIWFNRLIAIRFMEVNNYLPSRVRVLSSVTPSKKEPDMVTTPFETDLTFTNDEITTIERLKDKNKLDDLFRLLFIKQCNKLNEVLPALFEKISDYTEVLLNISFTDPDGVVSYLADTSRADCIPEEDFTDAVEIVGWLYQYYNTEPKAEVFADLKKNVKITKEKIPAATQLFTPDWIVRYMVENSLGRLWQEAHPDSTLKATWRYFLEEAPQEESVQAQLDAIRAGYHNMPVEEIKVIDPCMGSGHVLVYAFDVLMQLYTNQGYGAREAASLILQNNLYGLDIDERAYQMAYFALKMKARSYDRRYLTREDAVEPQVYCPKGYMDGEEYGSLLEVRDLEVKPEESSEITLFDQDYPLQLNTWNFRRLLHQKYDVVVTNPPYMGASGMSGTLAEYVKKNYPDSKSDMFAVFIERGNQMTKQNGYNSMVTMQSWMFLSSFEKMRKKIIDTKTITNLMHMENMVMGIAFGTAVTVIKHCLLKGYKGTYNHITIKDIGESNQPLVFPNHENRFAQVSAENFSKIPSSPIAYWAAINTFLAYDNKKICDYFTVRNGISTGDNERYLRRWSEVIFSDDKWKPCNKGGSYRKWYGNNEFFVYWNDDGHLIRTALDDKGRIKARLGGIEFTFKEAIEMTRITSGELAFRYSPKGFVYESSTNDVYQISEKYDIMSGLGYFNSKVTAYFLQLMNPTINIMPEDLRGLPYIKPEKIHNIVQQNISIAKIDWDSYETSWDFVKHPFLTYAAFTPAQIKQEQENGIHPEDGIQYAFERWQDACETRFNQLKANEEELNRIFIDIYGLQDELTPEVEDKEVTVRKADLTRDVKSFISYAVGCMFGRYSPLKDGLLFAGGEWNERDIQQELFTSLGTNGYVPQGLVKEMNFIDQDNVIPICDEAYLEDDIVGKFVSFVRMVYGEQTLEANLAFIADALDVKGDTPLAVIRNYFLTKFYADHLKIYQKRPIYWLYDSGKQNAFKALVYMHRYTPDTTGTVRVKYLHKLQKSYDSELESIHETLENSTDAREKALAAKRKEKLIKQQKEAKDYDAQIAHLALAEIEIDLDDGVKVNYEKIQTTKDGKKLAILGKI